METEQTGPDAAPEPARDPAPDPAPAPAPDPASAPDPGRGPRRVGRTVALIAVAVVLGVLAGTATGYAVQSGRPPTPLPPLAQQHLPAPKPVAADDATTEQTVNANRRHRSDEDLTKALLPAPGGTRDAWSGYEPLEVFVTDFFEHPNRMAPRLAADGLRRIAVSRWSENENRHVEVRLIQFQDRSGADDYQSDQSSYQAEDKFAGHQGVAIPGVSREVGGVWIYPVDNKPGYHPLSRARALVRRGDTVVDIWYADQRGKPITEKALMSLVERQLERL
ncbi:hypothetical protein [Streptomyces venezuelae]|uniref:hypothetical protein n=1 Tax=Streptomyces venezuelae TaxID=54571 RepID=UPI0016813323|nr:hypothetical protein [Streptomyces venezuelae]